MNLGLQLKKHRKSFGLTQESLANSLQVNRVTITNWENNVSLPPINKLVELAKIYDITLEKLILKDPNILINSNIDFINNIAKISTVLSQRDKETILYIAKKFANGK